MKHKLEKEFKIKASKILDAILYSSDLIKRGIKGVIAEQVFYETFLTKLPDPWELIEKDVKAGDFVLQNKKNKKILKIQIKMQRQTKGKPLSSNDVPRLRNKYTDQWVVEVQKTRSGTDSEGNSTRRYKKTDFDVLAVCLYSSSGDWSDFVFIKTKDLDITDGIIGIFQAVSPIGNGKWHSSLSNLIKS